MAKCALIGNPVSHSKSLQTNLNVPVSISHIIIGLLLFCMLGCEFFINYRMILRSKAHGKEAASE